jgi:hypothetical protein
MESTDKKSKRRTMSTNSSPREESPKRDQSPRIKIVGVGDAPPVRIICPRCKSSNDIVRLGLWKERDATVYFCGTYFGSERACRNVWIPDYPYIQVDEVNMRYLPGPDGDYYITFK